MKKALLFEILRLLQSRPDLKRKIKIFAIVGGISFFIFGGLAIWAGVAAVNYLASSAIEIAQSPASQQHLAAVKEEVQKIKFQPANCLSGAQNLLGFEPWIKNSALENLRNLKTSCFESSTGSCTGWDCESGLPQTEGSTI